MARKCTLFIFSLFLAIFNQAVLSSNSEEEELLSVYGDEELVAIATGAKQPIAKAPAVATVITAEDIRAIGASDLDEVLETVPGLHVSRSEFGYTAMYFIRGIFTEERNQQVLLLLNGVPLTNAHFGSRGNTWGGMPVRTIARVEVIRGPGSAVYGADAFAGVINVITKEYEETIEQAGVRGGSFDTQEGWMLGRIDFGPTKVAFGVEAQTTDGHRETIERDLLFGAPFSLAPGPINAEKDSLEAHLDIDYQKLWDLHLAYQRRFNLGTGAGIGGALDPKGEMNGHRFLTDFTWNYIPPQSEWDLTAKLSFLDLSDNSNLVLLPPGGAFPVGMLAKPEVYERHYRASFSTFYTGFQHHRLRGGLGVTIDDMYNIEEKKNYDAAFAPLPGGMVNVKHDPTLLFIEPGSRRLYFAFVQDEWALARNWDLTVGVRYDTYSDFGRTVNPRAALVWQTLPTLTTKALYGSAFRTPSFSEQRIKNNPAILGSSNLSPETIKTYEIAAFYQPSFRLGMGLSLFKYEMEDILRFATPAGGGTRTARNTGKQEGEGFELEGKWKATDTLTLQGNYAVQESRNVDLRHDAGHAPERHLYFRANWQFKPQWLFVPQLNWVMNRKRVAGDTRKDVQDYASIDFALRYREEKDPFNVALIGRNLLDEEAREPTLYSAAGTAIPKDLPLPGRAFYVEAALRLQ